MIKRRKLVVLGIAVYLVATSMFFVYSTVEFSEDYRVEVVNYSANLTLGGVSRMTLKVENRMDSDANPQFGYVMDSRTKWFRKVSGRDTLSPGENDTYVLEVPARNRIPRYSDEMMLAIYEKGTQHRFKKKLDFDEVEREDPGTVNPGLVSYGDEIHGWTEKKLNSGLFDEFYDSRKALMRLEPEGSSEKFCSFTLESEVPLNRTYRLNATPIDIPGVENAEEDLVGMKIKDGDLRVWVGFARINDTRESFSDGVFMEYRRIVAAEPGEETTTEINLTRIMKHFDLEADREVDVELGLEKSRCKGERISAKFNSFKPVE